MTTASQIHALISATSHLIHRQNSVVKEFSTAPKISLNLRSSLTFASEWRDKRKEPGEVMLHLYGITGWRASIESFVGCSTLSPRVREYLLDVVKVLDKFIEILESLLAYAENEKLVFRGQREAVESIRACLRDWASIYTQETHQLLFPEEFTVILRRHFWNRFEDIHPVLDRIEQRDFSFVAEAVSAAAIASSSRLSDSNDDPTHVRVSDELNKVVNEFSSPVTAASAAASASSSQAQQAPAASSASVREVAPVPTGPSPQEVYKEWRGEIDALSNRKVKTPLRLCIDYLFDDGHRLPSLLLLSWASAYLNMVEKRSLASESASSSSSPFTRYLERLIDQFVPKDQRAEFEQADKILNSFIEYFDIDPKDFEADTFYWIFHHSGLEALQTVNRLIPPLELFSKEGFSAETRQIFLKQLSNPDECETLRPIADRINNEIKRCAPEGAVFKIPGFSAQAASAAASSSGSVSALGVLSSALGNAETPGEVSSRPTTPSII